MTQYKPGRITVALQQPSWCILTRSGWAIELPRSYSHTCPHLKSAADMCTHTQTYTLKDYMPFMGWSHHMRRPNTFDCSKVRNSEKLIWKVRPLERHTDSPLVYNQKVLSKWKSVSYHVMFTFQDGYKCNIFVVPFSLFSWTHLAWWNANELLFICLCLWFIWSAAEETLFPRIIQNTWHWNMSLFCNLRQYLLFQKYCVSTCSSYRKKI